MSESLGPNGAVPSDLELMQLADGELDPEREAAVRAFVGRDPRAQSVLASLALAGDLLREDAAQRVEQAGADDVAGLVMDRIGRGGLDADGATVVTLAGVRPVAGQQSRRRAKWFAASGAFAGALAAAAAWAMWVNRWDMELMPRADAETSMAVPGEVVPGLVPGAAAPQVGALDLGGHIGSVFMVPMSGGTTVVLWIDEAAPPKVTP